MYINPVCNSTNYYFFLLHFHSTKHVSALYGHQYNNIWTVACVILTHLKVVWQFRQIQTPDDGYIGPKHVVLSESEGEKNNNLLHYRRD
jgi:hypothetical protein